MSMNVDRLRKDRPAAAWTPWGHFPVRTGAAPAKEREAAPPAAQVRRPPWLVRAVARRKDA